jgi:zinc transporter
MTNTDISIDTENGSLLWSYQVNSKGFGKPFILNDQYTSSDDLNYAWIHLRCDKPDAETRMQQIGLDPKVIDALTVSDSRPEAMMLAGGALLVLRSVNTNPGADPEDMVSIRLWFTNNMIVTARRSERRLLSIIDVQSLLVNGSGPTTTSQFVTFLVERIANRIGDFVDSIDDNLTEIELNTECLTVTDSRRVLSNLRKQTASIRRYLAPQRTALDTLFRNHHSLSAQDSHDLQLQSNRILMYVEDLDLARERALVLQNEFQDRLAEEQNQRVYVLSIVAAIFLPLSFLTGVFGMNVGGLPGTESKDSFLYLTLAMIVIGVGMISFMHWKRWI